MAAEEHRVPSVSWLELEVASRDREGEMGRGRAFRVGHQVGSLQGSPQADTFGTEPRGFCPGLLILECPQDERMGASRREGGAHRFQKRRRGCHNETVIPDCKTDIGGERRLLLGCREGLPGSPFPPLGADIMATGSISLRGTGSGDPRAEGGHSPSAWTPPHHRCPWWRWHTA